ncbi:hypothetical protein PINS_up001007 [Pythium insidiosum]|nr:hypothetical protein PINS_up001007 [Pythium insidiosum]
MVTAGVFGRKYELFIIMKATPSKVPATDAINKTARHGSGRAVWRQLELLQTKESVQIYGNKTAGWNADISLAFLDHLFGDRVPTSPPIMLLLYHFSGH